MTMTLRTVCFLSLLFAAFALVPAGAHLAELVNKMRMDATEYQTVQQIYRGWELFGVVVLGVLGSTLALTMGLRGHPTAFTPALVAFLCIIGTQVVFWTFTFPVNRVTVNWTVLPDHWAELRARWEYSHCILAEPSKRNREERARGWILGTSDELLPTVTSRVVDCARTCLVAC
jgi:hypothetical protein